MAIEAASVFSIRIRKPLVSSLAEMYRAAAERQGMPFEDYLAELLETSIVDFRRLRVNREVAPCGRAIVLPGGRQKSLSATDVQLLLHLRATGHTIEQLARRFHCSSTTVGRVCRNADEPKESI